MALSARALEEGKTIVVVESYRGAGEGGKIVAPAEEGEEHPRSLGLQGHVRHGRGDPQGGFPGSLVLWACAPHCRLSFTLGHVRAPRRVNVTEQGGSLAGPCEERRRARRILRLHPIALQAGGRRFESAPFHDKDPGYGVKVR